MLIGNSSELTLTLMTVFLPLVCATLATTLAGVLSQDKWPNYINDIIAITFVLASAVADVVVTSGLSGNLALIIGSITFTLTIGFGTVYKPLQRWTMFLQKTVFVLQESGLIETGTMQPMTTRPVEPIYLPSIADPAMTNADGETTTLQKTQFILPPQAIKKPT